MTHLTIPQRKPLESAAKTGNAWNAWGNVYRTSTNRMMQALCARGLLTHDGRPTDKTDSALGVPTVCGAMKAGAQVITAMDPAQPGEDRSNVIIVCSEAFDRITEVIEGGDKPNPALKKLMERPTRFSPPPGAYTGRLGDIQVAGRALRCGFDVDGKPGVSQGFKASIELPVPAPLPAYMFARHRVRTYSAVTLGIDNLKVMRTEAVNSIEMAHGFDRQDAYVCRIEQELARYDGRRRAPGLDRKVAKLRKILRTLKRGLYE